MAIPTWLTVSPTTGNKNASVSLSAPAHSGRSNRTASLTVQSSAGTPQKTATISVTQTAKDEFLTINTIAKQPAAGNTNVTITGNSNAQKIDIITHPKANATEVSMTPKTYTVNGSTYNSGAAITGDPGASAAYLWTVTVSVPVNISVLEQSFRFGIQTPNTEMQVVTITQSGAAPTISLDKSSVSIAQAGGSQSVAVTSNTTWAVS